MYTHIQLFVALASTLLSGQLLVPPLPPLHEFVEIHGGANSIS